MSRKLIMEIIRAGDLWVLQSVPDRIRYYEHKDHNNVRIKAKDIIKTLSGTFEVILDDVT